MGFFGGPLDDREAQLKAMQKRIESDLRSVRPHHDLRNLPRSGRRPSLLRRFVRFLRGGGD